MSEQTEMRSEYPSTAPASGTWAGWVHFGAIVMVVVGVFGVLEGLAATLSPTYFVSTAGGAVFVLSWATWGWVHLILGALVALVGVSMLGEAPAWARSAAIVLVALSAIVHLIAIPVAPVWSIVVIGLDVLVLYALVTTWGMPLGTRR
ncbi:membrane protein [Actinomycetospora sp. NBRC 106375]|uniref:DUF7144 family membrane protein n=1 Tax=Actinomycetospora sp. NBRC 106375 TaxID=3032207 RepID=UPI0024A1F925|nr:hypothetical protein [Actinomycetospora sp. NBRC 106375]GLZ49640.1 membrane protein [Actinomycetospora sp. NBRC 106375]